MRLRTQLVLAAFLLAIVPLVAIVVYSYESSRTALEAAYRRQSARMTRQMDARLTSIRAELDSGLAGLSAIPIEKLPTAKTQETAPIGEIVMAMGEAAPFVDALSFEPAHAPTAPPAPVVVDIPPMPRFQLPADFHDKMVEIRSLSRQVARTDSAMSAEERKAATDRLTELNATLKSEMEKNSAAFKLRVEAAVQQRDQERARGVPRSPTETETCRSKRPRRRQRQRRLQRHRLPSRSRSSLKRSAKNAVR